MKSSQKLRKMSNEIVFKTIKDLRILKVLGKKNNKIVYTCK